VKLAAPKVLRFLVSSRLARHLTTGTLKRTPIFFLTLAAFVCLTAPGWGDTLPIATINATVSGCTTNPCSGNFLQTATQNGPLSSFGENYNITSFIPGLQETGVNTPGMLSVGLNSTISAMGFPFPTLSATVAGSTGGGAQSQFDYYFEVVQVGGGATPAAVQVGVTATGSTSTSTAGSLQSGDTLVQMVISGAAGTGVDDEANVVYGVEDCDPPKPCVTFDSSSTLGAGFVSTPGVGGAVIAEAGSTMSGGFNETGTYSEFTNIVYEVSLKEDIQSAGNGGASSSAFIDPVITVPNGYELEFSPGIGNSEPATGVPEPSSVILLVTALLAVALVLRRRIVQGPLSQPLE